MDVIRYSNKKSGRTVSEWNTPFYIVTLTFLHTFANFFRSSMSIALQKALKQKSICRFFLRFLEATSGLRL